ncbi:hypothetical protein AQ911_13915 [Burkholderia pseudomallei]|nr:hypothetical protein AQ911_13915 [Burkholderia pseudomallei]
MFKKIAMGTAGVGLASFAGLACAADAAGVDFTQLTSSISWASVIAAVMAVAASMVGVYVAIKGSKIVLRMVRGA